MYLNEQVIIDETSHQEVFYFQINDKGEVLKSRGRYLENGYLLKDLADNETLPEEVLAHYHQFIKSNSTSFKTQLLGREGDEVVEINCVFTAGKNGTSELYGYSGIQKSKIDYIPVNKLPYPIAVVKKDGEITLLNASFIDYFMDKRIVARPIFIQDIIKTNTLSPESFDYLKMIESDANSRAVFCHFKNEEKNQTFLLNLIPTEQNAEEMFVAAVKDLTQFIEVQKNLEDQNEELRKQVQDEFEINKSYELKLLKKNRLESLGEIASGIFHELNQPLTHLSLKLDNMFDKWKEGDVTEEYLWTKTEQIQRQILRMRGIIDEMKQFSAVPERRDKKVNVKHVLNCALEDVSYIQVKGLILVVKHIEELHIMGSENELEQVFVNILTNSLQSLQLKQAQGKVFKPKLRIVVENIDEQVKICFIDNGRGASEDELKNIFKPFFTTKKEVGGTGLGLFIINNLMRKMNGVIDVKSIKDKYFRTTLSFPVINKK